MCTDGSNPDDLFLLGVDVQELKRSSQSDGLVASGPITDDRRLPDQ